MFPSWRLRLREARLAWQHGRYDEAGRLLSAESLREFLPAKELAREVAEKMVERAGERFATGRSTAGWDDLATADRLGIAEEATIPLRRQYAQRALGEAWRYLAVGEPAAALTRLEKLQRRGLVDEPARRCKQIARLMQEAGAAAAQGHFAEASAAVARARGLARQDGNGDGTMEPIAAHLDEQSDVLTRHGAECQRLSAEMHAALAGENWSAALSAAEALLAIAPRHVAARQVRRRAWRAVGMDVTQPYVGRRPERNVSLQLDRAAGRVGRRSTRPAARSSESDTVAGNERPQRALLWVDAVGGYLVCLDDYVVLGQPSAGEAVAVPILADLSRRHAVIRRDGGQYVLEPVQRVSVDGREISGPVILTDDHMIQLGDSVRLRFTRPHALSATARLVIESHHKTQPSADAILLMADSCVLGPNKHCHVECRDWQHDVVVYRQDGRLYCRADQPIVLDGEVCSGATEVRPGARVEGQEFAFTWEVVE